MANKKQDQTPKSADPNKVKYKVMDAAPEYTGSEEVAAAAAALAKAEAASPGKYRSQYSDEIKGLTERILSGEKFSYDFNADPVYNVYREQAETDRRRAVADAVSSAALLTGGYGNSYGVTAAQEASAKTYENLRSIIPSLLEAAYNRWYGERELEQEKLRAVMDLEDSDYGKYRDAVFDWQKNRDYAYGKWSDMSQADFDRYLSELSQWNTDRDYDRRVYEYDEDAKYRAERAAAEDAAKQRELELKQKEYELEVYKAQQAAAAAAASAAAKTYKASSSSSSSSSSKKSSSQSKKSDENTATSLAAKQFMYALTDGTALDSRGYVRMEFIDEIKDAKKKEIITKAEYDSLMNYFRARGIVAG